VGGFGSWERGRWHWHCRERPCECEGCKFDLNNFIIYFSDDEWEYEKKLEGGFGGEFVEPAPATMDGGSCPNQYGSAAHWPEPCFNKTVLTFFYFDFRFFFLNYTVIALFLYFLFLNIRVLIKILSMFLRKFS